MSDAKGKTMKDEAPICTWPSCKCTARDQCLGLGARAPSPAPDVRKLEAENARLREALQKITWALDEDHGDMEARAFRVARAALATQEDREDG